MFGGAVISIRRIPPAAILFGWTSRSKSLTGMTVLLSQDGNATRSRVCRLLTGPDHRLSGRHRDTDGGEARVGLERASQRPLADEFGQQQALALGTDQAGRSRLTEHGEHQRRGGR